MIIFFLFFSSVFSFELLQKDTTCIIFITQRFFGIDPDLYPELSSTCKKVYIYNHEQIDFSINDDAEIAYYGKEMFSNVEELIIAGPDISEYAFYDTKIKNLTLYSSVNGNAAFSGKFKFSSNECIEHHTIENFYFYSTESIRLCKSYELGCFHCISANNVYVHNLTDLSQFEVEYKTRINFSNDFVVKNEGSTLIITGKGSILHHSKINMDEFRNKKFETITMEDDVVIADYDLFKDVYASRFVFPMTSLNFNDLRFLSYIIGLKEIVIPSPFYSIDKVMNGISKLSIEKLVLQETFKELNKVSSYTITNASLKEIHYCGKENIEFINNVNPEFIVYYSDSYKGTIHKNMKKMTNQSVCMKKYELGYSVCSFNWVEFVFGFLMSCLISLTIILSITVIPLVIVRFIETKEKKMRALTILRIVEFVIIVVFVFINHFTSIYTAHNVVEPTLTDDEMAYIKAISIMDAILSFFTLVSLFHYLFMSRFKCMKICFTISTSGIIVILFIAKIVLNFFKMLETYIETSTIIEASDFICLFFGGDNNVDDKIATSLESFRDYVDTATGIFQTLYTILTVVISFRHTLKCCCHMSLCENHHIFLEDLIEDVKLLGGIDENNENENKTIEMKEESNGNQNNNNNNSNDNNQSRNEKDDNDKKDNEQNDNKNDENNLQNECVIVETTYSNSEEE